MVSIGTKGNHMPVGFQQGGRYPLTYSSQPVEGVSNHSRDHGVPLSVGSMCWKRKNLVTGAGVTAGIALSNNGSDEEPRHKFSMNSFRLSGTMGTNFQIHGVNYRPNSRIAKPEVDLWPFVTRCPKA